MNERERLMEMIQSEDFTVYETVLYLDGHPCDRKALEFYREHRDNLVSMKEEYKRKYGPLTIYENYDCDTWSWIECPWPWEREAN
ncbi:MAG: spore coat protein CotJB [Eubacteriales bacterium]